MIRAIFILQFCLLLVAAYFCFGQLNPDAISYIRVAEHMLAGDFGLAVNGYWSPLLSWLMVPLLAVDLDPLIATRLLMVLSAIAFSGGAHLLFTTLNFSRSVHGFSLFGVALFSVVLSCYAIAPDLLMAGGLSCLVADLIRAKWLRSISAALRAGAFCGLLYLCKAAALPISLLMLFGFSLMHYWEGSATKVRLCKSAAVFVLGLIVTAGPWIMTLSLHYGYPTLSTVAPIAHAIEGPWDYRPHGEVIPGFSGILKPDSGRLSTWEEPSTQAFPYWSPFESREYFLHQLGAVANNVRTNFLYILFLIGSLGVFLWLYRRDRAIHRIAWAASTVVGANVLVFLPTHAVSLRYFLPLIPLCIAATLHAIESLFQSKSKILSNTIQGLLATTLVLLLLRPIAGMMLRPFYGEGSFYPIGLRAKDLAQELEQSNLSGPIIGGNPLGFYLSYFSKNQWYGGAEAASPEDVFSTQPKVIIVNNRPWNRPLIEALNRSSRVRRFESRVIDGMNNLGLPEVEIFIVTE